MCGSKNTKWLDRSDDEVIKMGMEYEFETDNNPVKLAQRELLNHLGYHFEHEHIGDRDCTSVYGYEMKTPILSLKNWKKDYKIIWNSIDRPSNTFMCGIHVNVSKNDYTKSMFTKVRNFLFKEETKFKKLSRRRRFTYTRFSDDVYSYYTVLSKRKEDVYEFRLFHATKENSIIAMETAHLLFTHTTNSFTWEDFVRISKENKLYRNLARKLEELELAT